MVALWLIEFLLVALIAAALFWTIQQMVVRAKAQAQARNDASQLMRYEEARQIILQQAQRLIERGVPFEQAVLAALSDEYWPEMNEGARGANSQSINIAVQRKNAERKSVR
jgi:hypothetical protein